MEKYFSIFDRIWHYFVTFFTFDLARSLKVIDDLDFLTSYLEKHYHSLCHINKEKNENKCTPNENALDKLFLTSIWPYSDLKSGFLEFLEKCKYTLKSVPNLIPNSFFSYNDLISLSDPVFASYFPKSLGKYWHIEYPILL